MGDRKQPTPCPPEPDVTLFRFRNGELVTDRMTGFSGAVTGRANYLTGCNQYLVRPTELKADGDMREAQWLDEQRLGSLGDFHVSAHEIREHTDPDHPGADTPAPTK